MPKEPETASVTIARALSEQFPQLTVYDEVADFLAEDTERSVAIVAVVKHMIALVPTYRTAFEACPVLMEIRPRVSLGRVQ